MSISGSTPFPIHRVKRSFLRDDRRLATFDLRPLTNAVTPVRQLSPLTDPDWDAKVADLPGATFFHGAAWARVLREAYGFKPAYFAEEEGGRLRSLLPVLEVNSWLTGRRGVSLPFTDSCAPLGADPAAFARLLAAATCLGRSRRWYYLELRGGRSLLPAAPVFSWYFNHALDLRKDETSLFAGFESSVRRAVRKAEKSDLQIEFSRSLDAVRAFYGLHCRSRKRQGAPPQPFRFFETAWRHVIAENKGWVVLARQGATPVAGAVFLHWGPTALFKFGASDERYQELRPNNLVMARAIQWHRQHGFTSLDFGRTAPYTEGLRRFKLSWGAAEDRTEYLKFNFHRNRFIAGSNASAPRSMSAMKQLPLPVLRLFGALLYRHVA